MVKEPLQAFFVGKKFSNSLFRAVVKDEQMNRVNIEINSADNCIGGKVFRYYGVLS